MKRPRIRPSAPFLSAAIIAVLMALPVVLPAHSRSTVRTVVGVVTHVSDGDTLWVKPSGGGEALDVRIQGIDAPERCQDYGAVARQALANHVLQKRVTLTTKARDKYGRVIAHVKLGHQDVAVWMVASGHAWSYHSSRNNGLYALEEMLARQAGRGLWASGYAIEPREFRRHTKCHKPRN